MTIQQRPWAAIMQKSSYVNRGWDSNNDDVFELYSSTACIYMYITCPSRPGLTPMVKDDYEIV